jgi:hypothetical protein
MLVKPIAEMPKPRGKSSLFGGSGVRFIAVPRVVGHPPLAKMQQKRLPTPLEDRADHTDCKYLSQQPVNDPQAAEMSKK